ncbi:MAG: hypothetical protein BJ554DRAFT_6505, partial [Olpidium bornovanus]
MVPFPLRTRKRVAAAQDGSGCHTSVAQGPIQSASGYSGPFFFIFKPFTALGRELAASLLPARAPSTAPARLRPWGPAVLATARRPAPRALADLRLTPLRPRLRALFKTGSTTAAEALVEERKRTAITTSCAEFDAMLGKGVPLGKVVEICGAPGLGKTQLGYVSFHCPGGLSREIARATAEYINREVSARPALDHDDFVAVTEMDLLDRIHYYRVHNHVELIAVVNILDEIVDQNPKIRLVVIDSIAFHFRLNFKDMTLRTRLLNRIALSLGRLAEQSGLA